MNQHRTLRSRATVLGLAALSCMLLAPALAHDTHRHSRHHGDRHVTPPPHHARYGSHVYDRHHVRSHGNGHARTHREFVIPVHLTRTALRTYRNYHRGQTYYGPHRHHHAVYDFPVYTDAGWAYRPHSYCNGDLFRGRAPHHDHHVRFSLRF